MNAERAEKYGEESRYAAAFSVGTFGKRIICCPARHILGVVATLLLALLLLSSEWRRGNKVTLAITAFYGFLLYFFAAVGAFFRIFCHDNDGFFC